MIVNNSTSYIS